MISLPLKFDEVESVEEFVNMVKRLDYDVDVKIGRCVFDAKSLMSVLMIAGNPDAVVEAHTNDIEAFKKKFNGKEIIFSASFLLFSLLFMILNSFFYFLQNRSKTYTISLFCCFF